MVLSPSTDFVLAQSCKQTACIHAYYIYLEEQQILHKMQVQTAHFQLERLHMHKFSGYNNIYKIIIIQSSLRTKDTLGTGPLSFVRRLSLSRRFMIFQSILIVLP